jgi:hypothetical protein
MKREQITGRLAENAIEAIAIQHQFDGQLKQYEAACLLGDNRSADAARQALHNLLDTKLDNKAGNMLLVRTLASSKE